MATFIALISFVWCTSYAEGFKTAADNRLPMIIVIGTPTCLHCKVLDGHLETMDFGIRVAVKVDADKDPATAKQFNVTHYPTVILADDKGNITHRFVGSDAGPQLRKVLK